MKSSAQGMLTLFRSMLSELKFHNVLTEQEVSEIAGIIMDAQRRQTPPDRVYAVLVQHNGTDVFDLDSVEVFIDKKEAEKCYKAVTAGDASLYYDDARMFEWKINRRADE